MTSWDKLNRRIIRCTRCPRLREYCERIGREKRRAFQDWDYWTKPVPNFGDPKARLLVVGLAPAAHGANRTGRMFTGDRSGDWLFRALHKAGFANQPTASHRDDGLKLTNCAITAIAHCAPPANKPTRQEIDNCHQWLQETTDLLPVRVFLALGRLAWNHVADETRRRGWRVGARPEFRHGVKEKLAGGRWLLASYHPSQQNTFTDKLTEEMFDDVLATARELL